MDSFEVEGLKEIALTLFMGKHGRSGSHESTPNESFINPLSHVVGKLQRRVGSNCSGDRFHLMLSP